VPNEQAVAEMGETGFELSAWLGRMLRYCEGIDVLRGEP